MDFSKEMARHLPSSSDEWMRLIGLQRQSHGADIVGGVTLFGLGLVVGAGLAMIFAPTSGRELRGQIGERAEDLKERVSAVADRVAHAAPHGAVEHDH